ncbi:MAG: hypothetical protein IJK07_10560 [Bacteroidales bacterium]|nr:hypothetical protein [Bacteroidales bacterium]
MKTYLSKLLLAAMAMLVLTACGKRVLIDETHSFADNTWMRFEPEQFEVNVKNIDVPYQVTVSLQYDTTLVTGDALPLVVEFFADSNARHTLFPEIRLVDRGQRRGTKVDRFCTVVDTIDRCRLFNEEGTFTYRIKQRTSKYEIGGIAGLGLRVSEL